MMKPGIHETSARLKAGARGALLGKLGTAVPAVLLYFFLIFILSEIESLMFTGTGFGMLAGSMLTGFLVSVLAGVLEFGLTSLFMSLFYGRQNVSVSELFTGFKASQGNMTLIPLLLILSLVQTIALAPAEILMTIADGNGGTVSSGVQGIAAAASAAGPALRIAIPAAVALGLAVIVYFELRWGMAYYLLLDFPDMKAREVLKASAHMMKGRKGKLLYIKLSFLPLYLISVLSFGIAALWVETYSRETEAAFYAEAARDGSAI